VDVQIILTPDQYTRSSKGVTVTLNWKKSMNRISSSYA